MRIIIFSLLMWVSSVSFASAASQYPLCEAASLDGGELLYLSSKSNKNCWRILNGNKISISRLKRRGDSYRFTYVFGDASIDRSFDPIFKVLAKELNTERGPGPDTIELYRARMYTQCGGKGGKYRYNESVGPIDESAEVFNKYHRQPGRNPDKNLSKFHIQFLNSKKECVRTDSRDLKKEFALDPSDYGQRPTLLSRLFGGSTANAATGRYRRISVEIGNGEFRNTLFIGSFSMPAGKKHDIRIKDLSTYLPENGGRRRGAIVFSVE